MDRPSEVAFGNERRPPILNDERMAMVHLVAQNFNLGPCLARDDDPGNVLRCKELEGRLGSLPRVSLVIQQCAIEVGEKNCHVNSTLSRRASGRPSAKEVILEEI